MRVNVSGGWHHVVSRENGGDRIYRDDIDQRFLGLVSELPGRFSLGVHSLVLKDNHYHLLLRCREANLSEAGLIGGKGGTRPYPLLIAA